MLCGNNHGVDSNHAVVIIFYGNLGLSVRTEVAQSSVFPNLCQLQRQHMSQCNRHRHQFFGFVAGKTEHHALVSGAGKSVLITALSFFHFQRFIYALCDVRGLLFNRNQNGTSVSVEAYIAAVVTDIGNHLPNNAFYIGGAGGGNLTEYHYETGLYHGLACNVCPRVFFQNSIQDGIGNLVADFIRMSFGNGFRGKKLFHHNLLCIS